MGIEKESEEIIKEIKKRAVVYTKDNINNPPREYDIILIENAMLIGAYIALDQTLQNEKNSRLELINKTLQEIKECIIVSPK